MCCMSVISSGGHLIVGTVGLALHRLHSSSSSSICLPASSQRLSPALLQEEEPQRTDDVLNADSTCFSVVCHSAGLSSGVRFSYQSQGVSRASRQHWDVIVSMKRNQIESQSHQVTVLNHCGSAVFWSKKLGGLLAPASVCCCEPPFAFSDPPTCWPAVSGGSLFLLLFGFCQICCLIAGRNVCI